MRRSRLFLPSSVRGLLASLPEADRLELGTHLENLATLASSPEGLAAFAAFPEVDGRLVTVISDRYRAMFTVDPMTRLVFVHRLEPIVIAHFPDDQWP